MPSFFEFNQGTETGARLGQDSAPLLGRFRAVPQTNSVRQKQSVGDLFSSFTGGGSGSFGYGGLWRTRSNTSAPETEGDDWTTDAEGVQGIGKVVRAIKEVWIKPERHAVGWVLDRWWLRWLVMVGLPAMIVSSRRCQAILYERGLIDIIGCSMVCPAVSTISHTRRLRRRAKRDRRQRPPPRTRSRRSTSTSELLVLPPRVLQPVCGYSFDMDHQSLQHLQLELVATDTRLSLDSLYDCNDCYSSTHTAVLH